MGTHARAVVDESSKWHPFDFDHTGSPAEIAALRAGDVIVRVNNSEVKSTDDFSLLLEAAGESPVRFTVVRPDHPDPASVTVRLSEGFDPSFTFTTLTSTGRAFQ